MTLNIKYQAFSFRLTGDKQCFEWCPGVPFYLFKKLLRPGPDPHQPSPNLHFQIKLSLAWKTQSNSNWPVYQTQFLNVLSYKIIQMYIPKLLYWLYTRVGSHGGKLSSPLNHAVLVSDSPRHKTCPFTPAQYQAAQPSLD